MARIDPGEAVFHSYELDTGIIIHGLCEPGGGMPGCLYPGLPEWHRPR